jgi:transcriptional regulator with XRE-family HTH domain
MSRRRRAVSEHDLRARLSREVRRLRNEAGLTVKKAAAKVRMHPRVWQKIEGGETNATLATLVRIGAALEVDPAVLLGEPPGIGKPLPSASTSAPPARRAPKPRK